MFINKLQEAFDSGNSWTIIAVIFIISIVILVYLMYRHDFLSQWAYESVVPIPKKIQHVPFVQKWFEITRGFNYDMHHEEKKNVWDYMLPPTSKSKTRSDCLISGFAFMHMLQHFCIAFFCPKLIPWSFVYGVAWEMVEVITHMHCALDIFWNTCGCLLGLLLRSILFPT